MAMIAKFLPMLLLGALAACDSPSVTFMGTQKTIVEIDGTRFSVHRREDRVEVYRTSFEVLPKRAEVFAKAEMAIEQATGCKLRKGTLEGDQALLTARLACDGEQPRPALGANLIYACQVVDGAHVTRHDMSVEAIECTLVEA